MYVWTLIWSWIMQAGWPILQTLSDNPWLGFCLITVGAVSVCLILQDYPCYSSRQNIRWDWKVLLYISLHGSIACSVYVLHDQQVQYCEHNNSVWNPSHAELILDWPYWLAVHFFFCTSLEMGGTNWYW